MHRKVFENAYRSQSCLRRLATALIFTLLTLPSLALSERIEGLVRSVSSSTWVVDTNQGTRIVELHRDTEILVQGQRASVGSVRQGAHVLIEGLVLDNGNIVANRVTTFGSDGSFYQPKPSLQPPSNSQTTNTRPQIGATFPGPLRKSQIWVDGREVTGLSQISGSTIAWVPDYDLDFGVHHVRVLAAPEGGDSMTFDWDFSITRGGATSPDRDMFQLLPAAGSSISTARPAIGAVFPENVQSVRLLVDGQDFTNRLSIWGNRATWTPDYDLQAGQHNVTISTRSYNGRQYSQNWNFVVPNWSSGGGQGSVGRPAAHLTDYGPGPGSVVTVLQPTISCRFSSPVRRNSIQMSVDGHDVTGAARRDSNRVSWTPGYNLDYGQHIVRVRAVDENGQNVQGEWTFTIGR